MTEEKKQKFTHIIMLAHAILADGKVDDAEIILLKAIAKREGLTDNEVDDILNGKKKQKEYTIPKDEDTKMQYLKDMAAMMIVDGDVNEEEVKLCVAVGKKLELPDEKVRTTISEIVAKSLINDMKEIILKKHQNEMPENQEDKNVAYDKQTGLKVRIASDSGKKVPRPPFSEEESFAMGVLAISLVGSKIQQPQAMMVFVHEFEGYTAGYVNRMMASVSTEFPKSLYIFKEIGDPLKKSYAAGFFATIINSCGADDNTVEGWRNCVNEILHLGGEATRSIEDGANWYNRFEHGIKTK